MVGKYATVLVYMAWCGITASAEKLRESYATDGLRTRRNRRIESHVLVGGCALTSLRSSIIGHTVSHILEVSSRLNLSHSHLVDQTDIGIWHQKVETRRRRAVEPRKLKTRQRRKMWLLERRFVCSRNFFTNFYLGV